MIYKERERERERKYVKPFVYNIYNFVFRRRRGSNNSNKYTLRYIDAK